MSYEEPIVIACKTGNVLKLQDCLDSGYSIDLALVLAASRGQLHLVWYLVEKGANIYYGDKRALRWATDDKQTEVVDYLKKRIALDKLKQI